MHHIALLARDVERVAEFYRSALDGSEVIRHLTDAGVLRSIWVSVGTVVVMVERSEALRDVVPPPVLDHDPARAKAQVMARLGWSVVAFSSRGRSLETWERSLDAMGVRVAYRSDWTLYFLDPENNLTAISAYPLPGVVQSAMSDVSES